MELMLIVLVLAIFEDKSELFLKNQSFLTDLSTKI